MRPKLRKHATAAYPLGGLATTTPDPVIPPPPSVGDKPDLPPQPQTPEVATQEIIALPNQVWRRGLRPTSDTLVWTRGHRVYKEMLADDQINACVALDIAMMKERTWFFRADGDDPKSQDAADFLEDVFHRQFRGGMPALLERLHTAKCFGHAELEKIYGPVTLDGSPRWVLLDAKLRAPWSFQPNNDEFGNIVGLRQRQANGNPVDLDPRDFIHYAFNSKYDSFYGYSAFRAAYTDWQDKKYVKRDWNIHLERSAIGFPHAKITGAMPPTERAVLDQALRNLNAQSGLVTGANVEIGWVTNKDISPGFKIRLEELNKGIARALLQPSHAGFAEQGTRGSNSQASTHADTHYQIITGFLKELASVLQEQVIAELVYWNFGPDAQAPILVFEEMDDAQKINYGTQWLAALTARAVQWTQSDENAYRDLMGMSIYTGDDSPDAIDPNAVKPYGPQQPILNPAGDATNPLEKASGMQAHSEPGEEWSWLLN